LALPKKRRNFAATMNARWLLIEKRRTGNDAKAEALTIIGDVHDHDVIIG
jgi:phosphoribosylpyrophosphate synthetase